MALKIKRATYRIALVEEPAAFGVFQDAPLDPWFNPYRMPGTERAWEVARDVTIQVGGLERFRGERVRKRRPADQERFDSIVTAVVADLTHHHLSGSPGAGLVVTRSKKELAKRSRYRPPIFTDLFAKVLDLLSAPDMAFLIQNIGGRTQQETRRTTIKAGPRLVSRIEQHKLSFADLTVADSEEVILLKRKRRMKEDGREDFFDRADLIEYADTATTRGYREEVHKINKWLKSADISFDKAAAKRGVTDFDLIHTIEHVDPHVRRLRRYFSRGSFQSGGRLFGGFWQSLERHARLRGLGAQRVESTVAASPRFAFNCEGRTDELEGRA